MTTENIKPNNTALCNNTLNFIVVKSDCVTLSQHKGLRIIMIYYQMEYVYCIYLIKSQRACLLSVCSLRAGAYLRWALVQG